MTASPRRPYAKLPFTLTSLREAYTSGVRPRDILEELLLRVEEINDPGIFIYQPPREQLLAEAEALGRYDPDKPLWGIPFAVKDNIDVAGMPTTAACPAYRYKPAQDAFAVAQLRAAGALPVGKTNLDQFATGLVGLRSPYPPPLNALDPAIIPGGSSSGSGVIVGHGAVPFALGTDTAGSGRVPAALNGVVGLKPSLGAISAQGVVPACRTLDTVSVFATSVPDARTVLKIAAAYDAKDPYARDLDVGRRLAPLPGPRIAVPDAGSLRFFGDEAQARAFSDFCTRLKSRGARLTRVDFTPFYDVADLLYNGAWIAERFAVIEDLFRTAPESIHEVTRKIVGAAEDLSAADAFRGMYRLAGLKRRCAPLLAGHDFLCVPTIPTFFSVKDLAADPLTPNTQLGTYTNFVNLLDLCALAFPTGPRTDGRPGSVTFIGAAGMDDRLAAEALAAMADAVPGAGAEAMTSLAEDDIALAVCGAHMSGLPLNPALTERGGRFLRATRTSSEYRLHALTGGPPDRPGLVRDPSGAAIALEVWALPRAQIGNLLAEIPAPLGLGQIRLSDGSSVAGFLCETAGLEGARDITAFGGWRAYLDGMPVGMVS